MDNTKTKLQNSDAVELKPLQKPDCAVTQFPVLLRPACNFNERKSVANKSEPTVDIILVHYTAMESAEKAVDWLCCEESQVSCHYLIAEDGTITQMVAEEHRAWHAGQGSWQGLEDVNSRSIGIELANVGPSEKDMQNDRTECYPDFPTAQIMATVALISDCLSRNNVPARNILAHSDIAPTRKVDPGERFPWAKLHEEGIGLWMEPEPLASGPFLQLGDRGQAVEALQTMLSLFGYDLEINGEFDLQTKAVVGAFQRHYRQEKTDGIADISTVKTLHKLSIPNS